MVGALWGALAWEFRGVGEGEVLGLELGLEEGVGLLAANSSASFCVSTPFS